MALDLFPPVWRHPGPKGAGAEKRLASQHDVLSCGLLSLLDVGASLCCEAVLERHQKLLAIGQASRGQSMETGFQFRSLCASFLVGSPQI